METKLCPLCGKELLHDDFYTAIYNYCCPIEVGTNTHYAAIVSKIDSTISFEDIAITDVFHLQYDGHHGPYYCLFEASRMIAAFPEKLRRKDLNGLIKRAKKLIPFI